MAAKSDFTPEEWQTILESTMMAGIAVTAADPSGLWGSLLEGMANAKVVLGPAHDAGASELVKAVSGDFETHEGRATAHDGLREKLKGKKPAEIVAAALEVLREAARIVEAKAPNDAPGFKAWLQRISRQVAEASTEGGFLGFGGERVSEGEKATLAQIAGSLGLAA